MGYMDSVNHLINKTNTQNYYNNQRADIAQQMTSLLQKKYGANNTYDINKGFNQGGMYNPVANYNTENQDYLEYQKLMRDYQNAGNAQAQYQAILTNQAKDSAIQGTAKEISEKYINEQLKAQGLANQGISESSKVGIANQYASAISNIKTNASNNIADLYSKYSNAQSENQIAHDESVYNLKQEEQKKAEEQAQADEEKNYNNFASMLELADSINDLNFIKEKYSQYLENPVDQKLYNMLENEIYYNELVKLDSKLAEELYNAGNFEQIKNEVLNRQKQNATGNNSEDEAEDNTETFWMKKVYNGSTRQYDWYPAKEGEEGAVLTTRSYNGTTRKWDYSEYKSN